MTPANDAATCALPCAFLAFELVVDLVGALGDQEQAADDAGSGRGRRSRVPNTTNSGAVSRIIQVIDQQQRDADEHRQRQADLARPRALLGGSLPARIEMKTMLSMPRTISSTVSVASAIQPSALVVHPNALVSQPDMRRVLRARQRAALGHVGQRAPGLGVLPDERGEIERDVFGWIRRAQWSRGRLATLVGRRRLRSSSAMSPSSCAMPSASRKLAIIGR